MRQGGFSVDEAQPERLHVENSESSSFSLFLGKHLNDAQADCLIVNSLVSNDSR